MGFGFSSAGLPGNYMNNLYWQVLNQTMANNMKMMQAQQESIYNAQMQRRAELEAAQAANIQAQQEATQVQQTPQAQEAAQVNPEVKDGKDDGKISFWEKCKNMGKGALNMVKGMFCDEEGFSLKRTLTTVAVAAGSAALIAVTGGAATPFLVAAGATAGAFQVGKGAYKAATAKTDAEAAAAWQDIGGGTLAVGLSVAGAKTAVKAAGKPVPTGKFASLKATAECFKDSGKFTKDAWNVIKHPSGYKAALKQGKANWNKAFHGEDVQITTEKTQPKPTTNTPKTQKIELSEQFKNRIADFEKQVNDNILKNFASNSKASMETALKSLSDMKNSLVDANARLANQVQSASVKTKILENEKLISLLEKQIDKASNIYTQKYPTAKIGSNNYPSIVKVENKPATAVEIRTTKPQQKKIKLNDIAEDAVIVDTKTVHTDPLFTKQNVKGFSKTIAGNQTQENIPAMAAQTTQTVGYDPSAYSVQQTAQIPQQYNNWGWYNMQPPMGTGLEFQDLYVSPYPDLIF